MLKKILWNHWDLECTVTCSYCLLYNSDCFFNAVMLSIKMMWLHLVISCTCREVHSVEADPLLPNDLGNYNGHSCTGADWPQFLLQVSLAGTFATRFTRTVQKKLALTPLSNSVVVLLPRMRSIFNSCLWGIMGKSGGIFCWGTVSGTSREE